MSRLRDYCRLQDDANKDDDDASTSQLSRVQERLRGRKRRAANAGDDDDAREVDYEQTLKETQQDVERSEKCALAGELRLLARRERLLAERN